MTRPRSLCAPMWRDFPSVVAAVLSLQVIPLALALALVPARAQTPTLPPQTLEQWASYKASREDYTVTSTELGLAIGSSPVEAASNTWRRKSVFDALVAARRARGQGDRWITLRFPDRPIWFDRPFVGDAPYLRLQGDGPNAGFRMLTFRDDSHLILGVPRTFAGKAFTPDHWYNLAGRLDSSVVAPHWGLRTLGNSHIASMAGYVSYPVGYWATSPGVCVNLWLDSTDAPTPTNVPICGLSQDGKPMPWAIVTMGDRIVTFAAAIQPDGSARTYAAYTPMPLVRGPHRYTLQHDLASGVFTAIVDGAVSHPRMQAGNDTMPAGSHFPSNQSTPFLIGALGGNSNNIGGDITNVGGRDIAVGGLKVSDRAEYREDGARLDGKPDNDQNRYFSASPGTLAYLPLDQDPVVAAPDRLVNISGGGRNATALYLSDEHGSPFSAIPHTEIRDLKLIGSASPFGQCVALGYALYVDARGCTFAGGAHGFASAKFGANYTIRLADCTASGQDAALFCNYGMWTVDRLHIPLHGRSTIRVDQGMVEGRDWFAEPWGGGEYFCYATRGSSVILSGVHIDIESGPYPTKAYFFSEGGGQNPGGVGGTLKLHDVGLGMIQPAQTLIQLRDGGGSGTCRVDVDSLTWVGGMDRKKLLDLAGVTRWRGSISADQVIPEAPSVPGITIIQPAALSPQPRPDGTLPR